MTMPNRPDPGEYIASDWGRAVHDATFTPRGVRAAAINTQSVGTTIERLDLSAVDDPGGWLASNRLTVPTDGAGLYQFSLDISTDAPTTGGTRTRIFLEVNATPVFGFYIDQEGTVSQTDGRGGLMQLDDGDIVDVWAQRVSASGVDPDLRVRMLSLIRVGLAVGG